MSASAERRRELAAERTRRWRARQAEGRLILQVVVDDGAGEFTDALIATKRLHPVFADNRAALEAAATTIVTDWLEAVTRHASDPLKPLQGGESTKQG